MRWGLLLYVGVLVATALTGENFSGSLWGLVERGDGLVFYVHLVAFVVLAGVALRGPGDWRALLQSVVAAGVLCALVGIVQAAGIPRRTGEPWVRVGSVFGNPNHLGHFLLFGIFFALVLLGEHARSVFALGRSARKRWVSLVRTWQCWWYVGVLALQGWGIAMTGSRGTSLALLAGLSVAGGLVAGRRMLRRERRRVTLLWSVGVVVVVAALVIGLGRLNVVGQLQPFFNYSLHPDGTAARRLAIWQAGFQALPERWLQGWGWGMFRDVLDRHFPPQVMRDEGSVIIFDRAHNFAVDHLISGGVLALAAYLFLHVQLVLGWLCAWWREEWSTLALASLFGLLVANFVFNVFGFPSLGAYVGWAVLLVVVAGVSERREEGGAKPGRPKMARIGAASLVVASVAGMLGVVLPLAEVSVRLLPAVLRERSDEESGAVVQKYRRFQEEWLLQFPEERRLLSALRRHPESFQLMRSLYLWNEKKKFPQESRSALAWYVARAQRLAPTHPQAQLMAASLAIVEERYAEAIADCERAIALNPRLVLPYWTGVEAAVRWHKLDLAEEYVARAEQAEREDPEMPGRYLSSISYRPLRMRTLARLLAQERYYVRAAETLVQLVELQQLFTEHQVDYHPEGDVVQLVKWYDQAGEREKARQIAREVSAEIPSLAEELRPYMDKRMGN